MLSKFALAISGCRENSKWPFNIPSGMAAWRVYNTMYYLCTRAMHSSFRTMYKLMNMSDAKFRNDFARKSTNSLVTAHASMYEADSILSSLPVPPPMASLLLARSNMPSLFAPEIELNPKFKVLQLIQYSFLCEFFTRRITCQFFWNHPRQIYPKLLN